MKRTSALWGVFGAVVLLSSFGCEKSKPSFSLLPDSETFFQNSGAVSPKIDLLWVIDNSGSMHNSQVNIANNFSSFISDFSNRNYDFRMAVIATDAYRELYTGSTTVSLFKSAAGTSILTPNTFNLTSAFISNIMVGITGYGDERALQSIKVAMDNPANNGLLRPDSYFAIIVVGDEDDFSHDGSDYIKDQYSAYTDPNHVKYNVAKGHTIEKYVEYLETLTGSSGATKRFSVNSIVIKNNDTNCLSQLTGGGQEYGIRNQSLAEATGGVVASLCEDFSIELQKISQNILTLSTQFFLKREPIPESIVVTVDGVVIPSMDSNPGPLTGGWKYNPDTMSIMFYGDYIPKAGAQISIDFDPVNLEI